MSTQYSKKFLAASLLKCAEEALLYFRETTDGGCVVIAPDGRKLRYTDVQLAHEGQRLEAVQVQEERKALEKIARAQRAKVVLPDRPWLAEGVTETGQAAPGLVTPGDSPAGDILPARRGAVTRSKRSESAEAAYQKRQQEKQKGKR